ncbi:MAG: glutathione peroxidase [Nitrospirales bacterium]|nr:glutathione peroxidase [Nitrospirales bacterium]
MLTNRPLTPKTVFLGLSILSLIGLAVFLGNATLAQSPIHLASSSSTGHADQDSTALQIYDFTMDDIEGNPKSLSEYKGKVVMVVNTASFCGNTPQYEGLQTLYERYRDRGFTILAFPANDFGKQEPGNNKEIAEFCYTKYSLEFPLFSKITVLGDQKHPLYKYLTETTPFKGEITWNFQKFLIDRKGQVIARYAPGQKPLTQPIVEDIERALSTS